MSQSAHVSRTSSMSKISNASVPLCRICQGSQNSLIQACCCKGSSAFVHIDCLHHWNQCRLNSGQPYNACEVCKCEYSVPNPLGDEESGVKVSSEVQAAYQTNVVQSLPSRCIDSFIKILSLLGYLAVHIGFLVAVTFLVFERANKMDSAEKIITGLIWSCFGLIWLAVGAYSVYKLNQRS